jgi:putative DNA primase/helicase
MSGNNPNAFVQAFDVDNQELKPIIPAPDDAGAMNLRWFGRAPDKLYSYLNAEGGLICYIGRWNEVDSQSKTIRPITFCETPEGERKWALKGVPAPKPLYNLDKLAQYPECSVMICEGEKTADAAKILFPDFIGTTVMGGANAVKHADLTPLKGHRIKIAMDYDETGKNYGKDLVKRLQSIGVSSIQILSSAIFKEYAAENGKLVPRDGDLSQNYDLADALAEGWTAALIMKYTKECGDLFVDPQIVFDDDLHPQIENIPPSKVDETSIDNTVKASEKHAENRLAGSDISFPDVEPWPDPVDVSVLLEELMNIFRRCAILPENAALAISLWVVFTWCIDHFEIAPILALCSPEKRCGKTTVLNVLQRLVHNPQPTANVTPAALFRFIDKYHPTLLIDEADTFLKNNEELRGILNAGHNRDSAFIIRLVGNQHTPRKFNTWGAKAIALIGRLPETLEDRSIVIFLKRKRTYEKVEKLPRYSTDLIDTKCKLKRLSLDFVATPEKFTFPEGLSDRAADNWKPLLAIAKLGGSEWYDKAFQAMITLSAHIFDGDSMGTQLLHDISSILKQLHTEKRIPSQELLDKLLVDPEKLWVGYNKGKGLSLHNLSKLLKPYGIYSKSIRIGTHTCKGYEKSQFEDAFQRYLSTPSSDESVTSSQGASNKENLVPDSKNRLILETQNGTEKPFEYKGCDDVTDQIGIEYKASPYKEAQMF